MNPQALNALRESISHWEAMRDDWRSSVPNSENCALCRVYNHRENAIFDCLGCPITNATGYRYCVNTPYEAARKLRRHLHSDSTSEQLAQWHKAATAEIEFLKSLVPTEEKEKV